jgi:hypothetical protein
MFTCIATGRYLAPEKVPLSTSARVISAQTVESPRTRGELAASPAGHTHETKADRKRASRMIMSVTVKRPAGVVGRAALAAELPLGTQRWRSWRSVSHS